MKLYRLMCDDEFKSVTDERPFAWLKRCKWFADDINFLKRVQDGTFNNSKFSNRRYINLVVYDIEDTEQFIRVSNHELMLYREKSQLVKVRSIEKKPLYKVK